MQHRSVTANELNANEICRFSSRLDLSNLSQWVFSDHCREQRTKTYSSWDHGPLHEDGRSNPYVKKNDYACGECVRRSLNSSVRYNQSSASRQRPSVRGYIFRNIMPVSRTEESNSRRVPYSDERATPKIEQDD